MSDFKIRMRVAGGDSYPYKCKIISKEVPRVGS